MEDDQSYKSEFQHARKRRLSRVQTGDFINPSQEIDSSDEYLDKNLNYTSVDIKTNQKDFEPGNVDRKSESSSLERNNSILVSNTGFDTSFWDKLRRKILLDLQRHFKRKVEHDRLISSLLYDFLFVQCFVVILFVAVWYGTWSNFDKLFDDIIFHGDLKLSSGVALAIGIVGSICMISFQVELRQFSQNGGVFRMMIVSRFYSIIRLYLDILTWKGVFGIFDNIVDPLSKKPWYVPVFLHISAAFLLICGGGYRTLIGTPVGIGIDRPSQYISVPTFNPHLQSRDHSLQKRFLDGVCTVGFGLIAVCSFYGIWEIEEVYYQHRQGFNDTAIEELRGKNSWDCVGIGHGVACIAFMLQFVSLYFHADNSKANEERKWYTRLSSRILHDAVLFVAFFAYVNLFRGYWYVLDTYFIPGDKMMAHLICQFYGIFLLFMLYCGTSLHGGVLLERQRYKYGILIPNFFLTYLLATKVESEQPCTFGKKEIPKS